VREHVHDMVKRARLGIGRGPDLGETLAVKPDRSSQLAQAAIRLARVAASVHMSHAITRLDLARPVGPAHPARLSRLNKAPSASGGGTAGGSGRGRRP